MPSGATGPASGPDPAIVEYVRYDLPATAFDVPATAFEQPLDAGPPPPSSSPGRVPLTPVPCAPFRFSGCGVLPNRAGTLPQPLN
jgi:hypothetical protein